MKGESALSTFGYIMLGVAVALLVHVGLSFALSTDMPVVAVESNSMVPAFSQGDILLLKGVPSSELKVGDVIVYTVAGQGETIVHRITAKNPDGSLQTRGDANAAQLPFEKQISSSQVHGMVIAIVPYAGWIKIGVMNYIVPNMLWIVIAAAAAAAVWFAPRYIKRTDNI